MVGVVMYVVGFMNGRDRYVCLWLYEWIKSGYDVNNQLL